MTNDEVRPYIPADNHAVRGAYNMRRVLSKLVAPRAIILKIRTLRLINGNIKDQRSSINTAILG